MSVSAQPSLSGRAGLLLTAWVVLCVGLFGLHLTFNSERDRAHEALEQGVRATENVALLELRQRWAAKRSGVRTRMEGPLDPLVAYADIYLRRDHRQQLPRVHRPAPGGPSELQRLRRLFDRAYRGEAPQAPSPASAANENYIRGLARALARQDAPAIEANIRAYLGYRHRMVESAETALGTSLVMLEGLVAHSQPDPRLLNGWLRTGLTTADGSPYPSLQARLLGDRDQVSRVALSEMTEALVELCDAIDVPARAFQTRVAELAHHEMAVPGEISTAGLWLDPGGAWLLAPFDDGPGRAGRRIDVAADLRGVGEHLRDRGLLAPEDRLELTPSREPPSWRTESELEVRLDSPATRHSHEIIDRDAALKTLLLALCGLLGLGMGGFATLAELRRRRFLQLKSDFVATVSHELKTPLSSVRLLAETLERRLQRDDRARDYPRRIVRDVDHMSNLVENILSYARLERGQLKLSTECCRLGDLIDQVEAEEDAWAQAAEQRAAAAAEPGPAVQLERNLEVEQVDLDPELARLCLTNLLRNACQHGQAVSVGIRVESTLVRRRTWPLGRRQDWVRLRVYDDGPGVRPEDRLRIFEAFESSRSRAHPRGSGLGLAICAAIMAAHRGSIELETTEGPGACFSLFFPTTGASQNTGRR